MNLTRSHYFGLSLIASVSLILLGSVPEQLQLPSGLQGESLSRSTLKLDSDSMVEDELEPMTSPSPLPTLQPIVPLSPGEFGLGQSSRIRRVGNIYYADVLLDGRPLIRITAEAPASFISPPEPLPIEHRRQVIQNALRQVLDTGYTPDTQIVAAVLNGQDVLLASDPNTEQQQLLLTVTELDAQFARQSMEQLSEQWKITLQQGLNQAWVERQSGSTFQQLRWSGFILAGVTLISLVLAQFQRQLQSRWQHVQSPPQDNSAPVEIAAIDRPTNQRHNRARLLAYLEERIAARLPTLPESRWRDFNLLVRRMLQVGQLSLWLTALISVLLLFPYSREVGLWLLGAPIQILVVWISVTLANRAITAIVDVSIREWLDTKSLITEGHQRFEFRARTYFMIAQSVSKSLSYPLILILALYVLNVPLVSLLTGASVVGVIISFGAQGLVSDILNGIWILAEDQYAVGDWVTINGIKGAVVFMNIRITQLRDFDGHLVTLPHRDVNQVHNMTNTWARVNLTLKVAYEADIDLVLKLIRQAAQDLTQDPDWHDLILDANELLGVEDIAHDGIFIRCWIRTQANWHWAVSREFIYRLKLIFDQNNIRIGIPQHSIPQIETLLTSSLGGRLIQQDP